MKMGGFNPRQQPKTLYMVILLSLNVPTSRQEVRDYGWKHSAPTLSFSFMQMTGADNSSSCVEHINVRAFVCAAYTEEHAKNVGHHCYGNGSSPPEGRVVQMLSPRSPPPNRKSSLVTNRYHVTSAATACPPRSCSCQTFTQHPFLPLLTLSL